MATSDIAVLAAYFVTILTVGAVYAPQMKSVNTYFAGGKQLSWWIGGVSFLMSYVSALSIVVYAALGYQYGLVALTLYWCSVPASLLMTWVLAHRWRRAGIVTPVEFLETRFSSGVRQVFAWSGIPLKIIDEGLKIIAIGIFVSAGLKIPPMTAMIAVGVVTLIYTVLGGLWAVVITDFVQFVLVTTAILMLVPLSWHAVGGWKHFLASVPPGFFKPVSGSYSWGYIGAFFLLTVLSLSGNWSLIQKFYSARSDRDCRGIGWLATALFFILPPTWILTGIFARAFIPPGGFDPQAIYGRVSALLLPSGMLGLVIAALFAATMSVLSSGYNVIAAVLTVDIHQRLLHPSASQREMVLVGRILTAIVAALALAIALGVTYFHWTIFDTMVAAFGFFLPPTVLPMLAGLLSRRLSAAGAMAGFWGGIGIGLAFLLYRSIATLADPNAFQAISIVCSIGVTTAILVAAAHWYPATGEAAERAATFTERLNRPSAPAAQTASPAPIAGSVILTMGLVLSVIGLGFLAPSPNHLTLGTGLFFAIIGGWMVSSRFTRRDSQLRSELKSHGPD